jgi:DNA segregation ATPase FtsK/SpoIIIE, S-DNA-T family
MKNDKNTITPSLDPRLNNILSFFSLAIAAFIMIALLSYTQNDPGFSHTGSNKVFISNKEGIVGALIADFLLYFFGITSFILPVIMAHVTYKNFIRKDSHYGFYNWLGCLLVILTLNGLFAMHIATLEYFPSGIGGVIGETIAWKAITLFNMLGGTFVLLIIFCSGIILIGPNISLDNMQLKLKNYLASIKNRLLSLTAMIRTKISDLVSRYTVRRTASNTKTNDSNEPSYQNAIAHKEDTPPSVVINTAINDAQASNEAPARTSIQVFSMKNKDNHYTRIQMPKPELLDAVIQAPKFEIAKSTINHMSKEVEAKFLDFGIKLDVVAVYPGPVVTRFELKLAPGTKVSTISNLSKDLARTLSVTSVRIVDVIPGKSVIGLEIPNTKRQIVQLRDLITSNNYKNAGSPVTMILGKDISGHPVVVDLAKMPHLLVAGTTGSGKSVGLNAMLLSFLYKSSAENLRMILIDPKMLELAVYDNIPHLLTPVITDMSEAAGALRWCVNEMERRYKLMSVLGVRNIAGYNSKVLEAERDGSPLLDPIFEGEDGAVAPELKTLPAIVVVADEYSDMIMVLGKKVEQLIARLAQKARAAGIHLILATQRPSVNVVTGLIKANIPTRIAFQVSSRIDSRTVLDQQGAEQLLGNGDMLYLPPGTGVPVRVHGAYVSDDEVHRIVKFIKENNPPPEYITSLKESYDDDSGSSDGADSASGDGEKDALYDEAVGIVIKTKKVSISSIQRKLKIGYNRSANIVEAMEKAGLVSSPSSSNGTREVLVTNDNEY